MEGGDRQKSDLIGLYYMEVWKWRSGMAAEEDEPLPKELVIPNDYATVSDKLSVYKGQSEDARVVKANCPAPVKGLFYFFEITVEDAGAQGHISTGFANSRFSTSAILGRQVGSIGYHGHNGKIYVGPGHSTHNAETYTTGDTIGVGINYRLNKIFFTKNTKVVGTIDNRIQGRLYPAIAVQSEGEAVKVNFGRNPFIFDFEDYAATQRGAQESMGQIQHRTVIGIIRSYLNHYCQTLEKFDEFSVYSEDPENGNYALEKRSSIRKLIMDGNIDEAISELRLCYPQIVEDDTSAICFMLNSQKAIELARDGNVKESANYARDNFNKFVSLKEYETLVKDVAALLAYKHAEKSCVRYLLDKEQREHVADAVNASILSTYPELTNALHSYLERLLRQLTVFFQELESFHPQDYFYGMKI
ncbi:hypothetical protein L1887_25396 [Cichorium endivia]|nr:hypothetical protein L1887_25396 [Cichorium endivia]